MTDDVSRRLVRLPLWADMTAADVEYVIAARRRDPALDAAAQPSKR